MTSRITLAVGLSRTRRNNIDANSYLALGRTGQNGTAQDRVKPQTEHLTAAAGPYIKEWDIAVLSQFELHALGYGSH